MSRIHCVLICFNNPEQTLTRWQRDVFPGVEYTKQEHCLTVIDNSAKRSEMLAEGFGENYLWQGGNNLQYGPSINLAVPRLPSDYILYACTKHGKMFDPSWVSDLLHPFQDDEMVGQSGFLMGSNSPEGVAHAMNCPWVRERFRFTDESGNGYVPQHIQGGVFMGRTQAMLENPYHPDIAHLYTDHYITWALMKDGWKCVNVPTICSVWRSTIQNPNGMKFVHSDNFT